MPDIALCLALQGNFSDARDVLLDTLAAGKHHRGAAPSADTHAAVAHSNLSVVLLALGAPAEAAPHTAAALTLLRGGGAAAGVALPPTQFVRAAELMLLGVRPRPLQTCPCFQASCR